MSYLSHPLIKSKTIKSRLYQELITATAVKRNTLVVIPTGLGKTIVCVMVAAHRLEKFPKGKVGIFAPTRPLCSQHEKTFKKFFNIDPEKIVLVTGRIRPQHRKELYKKAKILVSTPQCIEHDIKNNILELSEFVMVCLDEAHRCVGNYAYTFIADNYMKNSSNPLLLGLTASPGGKKEKINEICKNLHIEAVEIRTETDEDVEPYVKPIEIEYMYVDFPEEFKNIRNILQSCLNDRIDILKKLKLINVDKMTKGGLIKLQERLSGQYITSGSKRDWRVPHGLSLVAEAIKIEHAVELLETQGILPLHLYFTKLMSQKSKATKRMLKDPRINKVMKLVNKLYLERKKHPKLEKLLYVIKDILCQDSKSKVIVFTNYRSSVESIVNLLNENNINAKRFVGQADREFDRGLKQSEQIKIIKNFKDGLFNVLVASSVGEEGLDIPEVSTVIFYEPIPSELRKVQRRGRTGRTAPGRVIYMITKDTRDESYYWASFHREKKMKRILYKMKELSKLKKEEKTLKDFLR